MNTATKRPERGFRAWLAFFLGLNIIFIIISAGLILLENMPADQLQYIDEYADLAISRDILDTRALKIVISEHVSNLLRMSKSTGEDPQKSVSGTPAFYNLEKELTNIACLVRNKDGVTVYDTLPDPETQRASDKNYGFLVLINGNSISVYRSDDKDLIQEERSGSIQNYMVQIDNSYAELTRLFDNYKNEAPDSGDLFVLYALRSDPDNYPGSSLYLAKQVRVWIRVGAAALLSVIIAAVLLMVYSSVKRENKRAFLRRYADLVSRIWFEIKLILIFFAIFILNALYRGPLYYYHNSYSELAMAFAILIACFWFFYLLVKDIQYNKAECFKHNSIRSLSRVIGRLLKRFRFERRMLAGFWIFAAAEILLIILFAISFSSGFTSTLFFLMGAALFLVATIRYHKFISDTGKIISQINRIKSGDLTTRLNLDDHSDLQEYAENLNSIQSGMSKALEERLASERLKVDLITNVSHDLKTPLTSIISYIDLLKKEELPKQAMEYAEVLSRKADRLKTMIQDIFIVSKAASGNMVVEKELLDLGRLVGQTLADMQEKIDASGLKFRIRHSEEPLLIRSDGQKLYRVLQNLIDNALCYSLKGSRVHIRSWSEKNSALVEIKNTSNLELDFTPQEIVERFVRGDASRSGDGSGLGLSIAQTFTEACGGSFNISIDYDDFKVRLAFPLEPKSSAPLFETVMSNASTQSPAPLVTTPHVDTTQASDESQDSPELKNATENPIAVATPVTDSANTLTIEPYAVNDCEVDVNETAGSEETVTTGTTDAAGETDTIDRTDITDTAGEAQTSDNN